MLHLKQLIRVFASWQEEKLATLAMLVATRLPSAPPFNEEEEHLAKLLAPHIARTLLKCAERTAEKQERGGRWWGQEGGGGDARRKRLDRGWG